MKRQVITTSLRLPKSLHKYITEESEKTGISMNALIILFLHQGIKFFEDANSEKDSKRFMTEEKT